MSATSPALGSAAMRVICVAGARPNFMKIKPVMDALDSRGVETILVHTGQHYDASMSGSFFEELGLREPDVHLGVGSGSHAQQTARVMVEFEPVVGRMCPDVVVVVGDVNSTMACAVVAAKAGPRVAHVEAGLRSGDWSMPEEVNRVVTDRVSDILLAPSQDAVEQLRHEGRDDSSIHLVGNVMIDTLLGNLARAVAGDALTTAGVKAKSYGLVTLHRPANVDDPAVLKGLLRALEEIARDLPLVFPVHPRGRDRIEAIGVGTGVSIVEPLGYLDFVALESEAVLVLTDSGGVQEETTVLGIPCLTLRDNTERPVTIEQGTNQLVGRDPERIIEAARRVLASPPPPRQPSLWDGKASERVADVLTNSDSIRRPTE